MIWLIGLLAFIVYRAFNAGMRSDTLFYENAKEWDDTFTKQIVKRRFASENLFSYGLVTLGIGITWPISLPCIGLYLLGKRYAK